MEMTKLVWAIKVVRVPTRWKLNTLLLWLVHWCCLMSDMCHAEPVYTLDCDCRKEADSIYIYHITHWFLDPNQVYWLCETSLTLLLGCLWTSKLFSWQHLDCRQVHSGHEVSSWFTLIAERVYIRLLLLSSHWFTLSLIGTTDRSDHSTTLWYWYIIIWNTFMSQGLNPGGGSRQNFG